MTITDSNIDDKHRQIQFNATIQKLGLNLLHVAAIEGPLQIIDVLLEMEPLCNLKLQQPISC